jgi:hypothetical protein
MAEGDERVECCEHCKYWEYEVIADGPRQGKLIVVASCRRYPPAMVVVEDEAEGYSPQTFFSDWCGEFKWWSDDPQAIRG